jgi:hypothetical protein
MLIVIVFVLPVSLSKMKQNGADKDDTAGLRPYTTPYFDSKAVIYL